MRRVTTTVSEFDEWNDLKMWHRLRKWAGLKSERAWGQEKEWRLSLIPLHAFTRAKFVRTEVRYARNRFFLKLYSGLRGDRKREMSGVVRRVILRGLMRPKTSGPK